MDSTYLKPTSSITPAWSRGEISKTASTGLLLSNSCCLPKEQQDDAFPGVSRMLWEPSRENTMGRVLPSGGAAGSLQALKHLYMPILLHINPVPSVSPWRHNRTFLIQTELTGRTIIHIITAPSWMFCIPGEIFLIAALLNRQCKSNVPL